MKNKIFEVAKKLLKPTSASSRRSLTGFTPLETIRSKRRSLMGPIRKISSNGAGFTLIELCIVLGIVAILAGTMAPLLIQGLDSWLFIREQNMILSRATLAMNRITDEYRFCDYLDTTTTPTLTWELRFYMPGDVYSKYKVEDEDGDGDTDLVRTSDEAGSHVDRILARNVQAFDVRHFVRSSTAGLRQYASGDAVTDIRFTLIRLEFTSELDPNKTYTFESGVAPRGIQ